MANDELPHPGIKERWESAHQAHYWTDSDHRRNKLAGLAEVLAILNTYYLTSEDSTRFSAEHDVLFLRMDKDKAEDISDGHIVRLSKLGVHWDANSSCLAIFT